TLPDSTLPDSTLLRDSTLPDSTLLRDSTLHDSQLLRASRRRLCLHRRARHHTARPRLYTTWPRLYTTWPRLYTTWPRLYTSWRRRAGSAVAVAHESPSAPASDVSVAGASGTPGADPLGVF
ncbi:MAG TPA: hypothetical protein VKB14_16270, partial [Actinomycetales bacterium]|nr:hypothetical protein [Actinomycetales bacterium]